MSRYAVSDIHGCYTTFKYLVEKEIQLKTTDMLFLLGDYIDRGPDSKGVMDFIMALQNDGYQVQVLRGNHEELLLQARTNPTYLTTWLMNGGKALLESFQITTVDQIPEMYWRFLEGMGLYLEMEDYLLVHAGFNFATKDPFSDTEAMLWTRSFEINENLLGNRKIIHGHTPIPLVQMADAVNNPENKVINIDGGCVYKGRFGHLAGLDLDTLELIVVPNRE